MSRASCFTCRSMTSVDQSSVSSSSPSSCDEHGVADGGEGVPQLVGEHREELVLAAVGLLQPLGLVAELLLGLHPLDAVRGLTGEQVEQSQVPLRRASRGPCSASRACRRVGPSG